MRLNEGYDNLTLVLWMEDSGHIALNNVGSLLANTYSGRHILIGQLH